MYKLMFYITIVNIILRTVTLDWHDSKCIILSMFSNTKGNSQKIQNMDVFASAQPFILV